MRPGTALAQPENPYVKGDLVVSHQANALIIQGDTVPELVAQAADGDADAFAALYERFRGDVYRYLRGSRHCDQHLAEDLTQDTFVRALGKIHAFAERPNTGGFQAWLVTIARNLYIDHGKRSGTRLEVSVADMLDLDVRELSAEGAALRRIEQAETVGSLMQALRDLTPAQRQVVGLRFFEGLPIGETATVMGKKHGAVKTLTFRAVTTMKRALTEAEGAAA